MKTLTNAALILAGLLTLSAMPSAVADAAPAPDDSATTVIVDGADAEPTGARFDVVPGFGRDSWNTRLFGGTTHTITVRGDGDSDLDLYVYDENGNLVASDQDLTDFCVVRITPRWTGPFTVVIKNRGRMANRYRLEITH